MILPLMLLPHKNKAIKIIMNKMLKELKSINQWVGWIEKKDGGGKISKIPINPNKKATTPASVSDPETGSSYKKAIEACQRLGLDGVGFVFKENDSFAGIDLDKCRDPKTGKIDEWAKNIIQNMDSYTEVSPSGTGLHIIVQAKLPAGGRKGDRVEIYDRGRYFTFTEDHLKDTPKTINKRDAEVKELIEEYFSQKETKKSDANASATDEFTDKEIIRLAKKAKNGEKFKRLWGGDASDYKSHSEADLALCQTLCFYAGKNPNHIDRLFRRSRLYRKKWDKRHSSDGSTYGQMTISKAIKTANSNYNPKHNKKILKEIVKDIELFHSPLNQAYGTMRVGDHYETWPIRSAQFGNWLRHEYYKLRKGAPKKGELSDVLDILEARAQFEGATCEIHTRIAQHDGNIYLDLANKNWEVVKINSESWEITKTFPVKFRRPKGMLPLPRPIQRGKVSRMVSLLNIKDQEGWVLTIAWLVGALRPKGPYPILMFLGPQGSAKSTQVRIIRSVIDPSTALLRSIPKSERDLMISANNSFVVAFDNLSYLKDWFSDALCRLATGGGFAIRQLYTNDDEVIFDAMRPIMLNGIDVFAYAHDLVDRCIIISARP